VHYRLVRCWYTINTFIRVQQWKSMVTADYYYPEWGCLVDFFAIWGWEIVGIGSRGLNPQPFRSLFSVRCLWPLSHGDPYVVMDPGQKFLTRVGSGQPFMVWVRIWKISPKNVKFFNFLPFGSKKIASGRVRKYPGQSRVSLLFTAGQK